MAMFDIPAPMFDWIDSQLGNVAPPGLRLAFWGIVGGIVSMMIYRAISAQERVAVAKREIAGVRRELNTYDGEFAGAWHLARRLIRLSFIQVGRVGWAAVVASLPLLCLLVWISTAFGYRYPNDNAQAHVEALPSGYQAHWTTTAAAGGFVVLDSSPRVVVRDGAGRTVADIAVEAPVPQIHKRRWWNALVSNPAGYLPTNSEVSRIRISLPRKEYLPFGANWMRGWEMAFFAPLIAASLAIKMLVGIE